MEPLRLRRTEDLVVWRLIAYFQRIRAEKLITMNVPAPRSLYTVPWSVNEFFSRSHYLCRGFGHIGCVRSIKFEAGSTRMYSIRRLAEVGFVVDDYPRIKTNESGYLNVFFFDLVEEYI